MFSSGKMRNLEKNMFTKEALALAWRYFLPPYTFQIRVGALYLLYGLYNSQLCQPKQKVILGELFPSTNPVLYMYFFK
jgi:snRNA-activating protein complex subunit 1